jgi:hypothetical protein
MLVVTVEMLPGGFSPMRRTIASTQLCRGDDSQQYRCGAKSANDLDAFIAGRPVSCIPISLDQYRRTVATCSVDGVDLGEWLVSNGLAQDGPQYSKGKYALRPSAMPSTQGSGYGRAAMLNRGCIDLVSGRTDDRQLARMMRTRIREECKRQASAQTPLSSLSGGHLSGYGPEGGAPSISREARRQLKACCWTKFHLRQLPCRTLTYNGRIGTPHLRRKPAVRMRVLRQRQPAIVFHRVLSRLQLVVVASGHSS